MPSYKIITGDLLEAKCEYIVQQNCCTATRPHGLSEVIATKWPAMNPYGIRCRHRGRNWAVAEDRPAPGSILVFTFDTPPQGDLKGVICAFAQYNHGKPGIYKDPLGLDTHDTAKDRVEYFKQCLAEITKITPTPKSVGFPFKIGSGLAGGSWLLYERMIREWAEANPGIEVTIYRLPGA
jgi:hypothetical protein